VNLLRVRRNPQAVNSGRGGYAPPTYLEAPTDLVTSERYILGFSRNGATPLNLA